MIGNVFHQNNFNSKIDINDHNIDDGENDLEFSFISQGVFMELNWGWNSIIHSIVCYPFEKCPFFSFPFLVEIFDHQKSLPFQRKFSSIISILKNNKNCFFFIVNNSFINWEKRSFKWNWLEKSKGNLNSGSVFHFHWLSMKWERKRPPGKQEKSRISLENGKNFDKVIPWQIDK